VDDRRPSWLAGARSPILLITSVVTLALAIAAVVACSALSTILLRPSQGAKVVLGGIGSGLAAALASTHLLDALLYQVDASDPVVFAAMSIVMIGIGLLASYVPARCASNVDAIESLRND
jgi:ABC-type lipoprotein release transport system permease subunit